MVTTARMTSRTDLAAASKKEEEEEEETMSTLTTSPINDIVSGDTILDGVQTPPTTT